MHYIVQKNRATNIKAKKVCFNPPQIIIQEDVVSTHNEKGYEKFFSKFIYLHVSPAKSSYGPNQNAVEAANVFLCNLNLIQKSCS